ncbi:MAG: exodeoxyribonuclease V subunit gamma [Sedimentisphaerales bacterium]|nr:exodeoxyribonuclease V subunit gamma [Sedimentisphaerales bacterium]
MAVQFVLGRSGTGKTTFCVRGIADALQESSEQPLLFLVPEQATYEAERAILSDPRVNGYHRLHILSFDRLQLLLLGRHTGWPAVSRIGREMLIHKILRDTNDKLRVLGSSALLPGFAQHMADTVSELHRYALLPEDVDELVDRLGKGQGSRLTALKFADIALIFRRYSQLLEGRFIDPQAQVTAARKAVADMDFVKGARLWIDGFASFTGAELAILSELLRAVDHAYVAFCVDPGRVGSATSHCSAPAPEGLFEPVERTCFDLLRRAGESKLHVVPPIILSRVRRFDPCPPLKHVEQNLFCPGAGVSKAEGRIRIISAPNIRAEIQFVARQILTLVRDKGYRYRDIAVVASDLDRYEHYVRAYFDGYEIPFFIDKRRPLDQHPVVALICTALEAVTGGFDHADVFAYLKSDLAAIDPAKIDLLENYCLAFGVDGRDWLSDEPWRFKAGDDIDFDEDAINRIREQAAGPLLALREALHLNGDVQKTLTAGAFTRCIFDLLDGLHVRGRLNAWVEQAREQGDLSTADEHRQFFDTLIDVFDELVEVFTHEEMTAQDYFGILRSAFSQMTLALIPPSLDQVLVGSIERSRHPNLKAIFLLGATQKQFPVPIAVNSVLTDEDRNAAEATEFHLAPTTAQSLADRQYFAYIAFTRPSEFLCVSFPCLDEKGGPVARSHFIDDLQLLFDDLHEEFIADDLPEIDDVRNGAELAELLCTRLGRDAFLPAAGDKEQLRGLLDAMQWAGDQEAIVRPVSTALSYDNAACLEPAVTKDLLGPEIPGSATRLATFAACPYEHFARYTLDLKPRREFKLEPLDLGRFYHDALDRLQRRLSAERQNFASVEQGRLTQLLQEHIAEFTEQDPFLAHFVQRSAHNAFIIYSASETLRECVLAIAQMVQAGSFRPQLSEVAFGHVAGASDKFGRFELPLPDGRVLVLSGKIDRVDIAELSGRRAALIFDYKRTQSSASFGWSDLYHGLDVQLAVYMLAVRHAGSAYADDVAGAVYLPVEATPQRATPAEFEAEAHTFQHKARGIINGTYCGHLDANASGNSAFYNFYVTKDQQPYGHYGRSNVLRPEHFARLLDWSRNKIVRLAVDIASGRIESTPYHRGNERGCMFCEFLPVCRFDWQINDYNFLKPMNKDNLIALLDNE